MTKTKAKYLLSACALIRSTSGEHRRQRRPGADYRRFRDGQKRGIIDGNHRKEIAADENGTTARKLSSRVWGI